MFAGQVAYGSFELPAVSGEAQYDSRQMSLDLRPFSVGDHTLEALLRDFGDAANPAESVSVVRCLQSVPCPTIWVGAWRPSRNGREELKDYSRTLALKTGDHGTPLEFSMPEHDEGLAAAFEAGTERLPPEQVLSW